MILRKLSYVLLLMLSLVIVSPALTADDGTKDLEEAVELKENAQTVRDFDSVVDLCESAIEKGLDDESKKLAVALMKSTLLEHAKQLGDRVMRPKKPSQWLLFRREALTRLDKAIEIDEKMADAYMLQARLYLLKNSDRKKAIASIDKAIEFAGDDRAQLSQALLMRGALAEDEETRVSDLNQAIKIYPDNVQARLLRGRYFYDKREFKKAAEDFKVLADEDKANIQVYVFLVTALIQTRETKEALEYVNKGIELDPRASDTYTLRAQIMLLDGKSEEAFEDTQRALKINPRDYTAHFFEAAIRFEKKEQEAALAAVDKALLFQPAFTRAIELRSSILASLEKFDEAIGEMKKLAEYDPDDLSYRIQLAMFYNAADRPKEAVDLYDQILEDAPDNPDVMRGRGDAYLSLGDHQKAIQDYDAILAIREDDSGTLNNLAWVLATSPHEEFRDGKRSIELGLKACELTDYKAPHILSTLAAGYAESGDFENARKWAAKAVARGEETEYETLDNLRKELKFYEEQKPWREDLSTELKEPNNGGGQLKIDDANSDKKEESEKKMKKQDSKDKEKTDEPKKEDDDKSKDDKSKKADDKSKVEDKKDAENKKKDKDDGKKDDGKKDDGKKDDGKKEGDGK